MTIPPVGIKFTGDADQVAVAIAQLTSRLQGLRRESRGQSAEAQAAARSTATFAERLRVGASAAGPFERGLKNLYDQEIRVGQGAATAAGQVNTMTAAMTRSASGTELFARGLRSAEQQQRAAASAPPPVGDRAAAAVTAMASRMGTLAQTYIGYRAVSFVAQATEEAAAMHELSQRTGATVETLSVLSFAGKRAGVDLSDITTGFRGLAISLGNLRDGNKETIEGFQAIGLSAQELEGLSVDEVFKKIAEALGELPPGFDRVEAAQRIFGRSGAALLPLLEDLATNGFGRLADEASRSNALISGEAARRADELSDRLTDLKEAAAGAGRELALGLAPGLTVFFDALQELITTPPASGVLEGLVKAAGETLRHDLEDAARLLDLRTAGQYGFQRRLDDLTGQTIRERFVPSPTFTTHPRNVGKASDSEAVRATKEEIEALAKLREAGKLDEEQKLRVAAIVTQLNQAFAEAKGNAIAQAEIEKQRASLTKEIRQEKERETEAERAARQESERRLEIQRQLRIQAAGFGNLVQSSGGVAPVRAAELPPILQGARQSGLISQATDPERFNIGLERLRTESERIFTDLALARERIAQQVQLGILTERQGQEQLASIEAARLPRLQVIAGEMADFARLLNDKDLIQAAEQLQLRVAGIAAGADLAAQRMARFKAGIFDASEDAAARFLGDSLPALGEPDPNSGAISVNEREAEEVRRRIEELNELAAAGDRDALTRVQALEQEYADLQDRIGELKAETFGLGDAFRQLFSDLANSVRRLAAELLAAQIVKGLTDLISAAGGSAGVRGNVTQSGGKAQGGLLEGTGSPTSDSNLFRGSRGEWIHPARAVDFYGHTFMHALDTLQLPRFAAGGLLGGYGVELPSFMVPSFREPSLPRVPAVAPEDSLGAALSQGGGREALVRLLLDVSPDLVLRTLEGAEGQRVQLETIGRHPRALQDLLDDA